MQLLRANARLSRLSSSFRSSKPPWICSSCRRQLIRKRYASDLPEAASKTPYAKPWYITTPIYYVNASPHIGHLYTLVLVDVLKRWQQLKGNTALMLTGTDEHGMKIQRAAEKAGVDPKAFCDKMYKQFETLADQAGIGYDHFIRTTDLEHKRAVEFFWKMLNERGLIYTSKHEGWYSVSDETFYPSSAVHLILEPSSGRKIMTSIETGKEVEWSSEINYHFRLSAFKDKLLSFYKDNPNFIRPKTRYAEVINEVTSGLEDLSISRPVERLSWGIRVPDDPSQTIYVWVDALINYITYAGYPFIPGKETSGGWPADVQVIGKDIVRFHCIYWPALLMALDISPPRQFLTHAHWTMGRQKMSKSTGNVVNPFFAIDRFGVDALRFFLVYDGGLKDDSPYDNSFIVEKYKKGLSGGLGNLASRVLRGKNWDVRKSVILNELPTDDLAIEHAKILRELPHLADSQMDQLNSRGALQKITEAIFRTNEYIHSAGPWYTDDAERTQRIIFLCTESLRICAILLQPFMPDKMRLLLDMLGVEKEPAKRSYAMAQIGADADYGIPKVDLGKGQEGVLFPRLACED